MYRYSSPGALSLNYFRYISPEYIALLLAPYEDYLHKAGLSLPVRKADYDRLFFALVMPDVPAPLKHFLQMMRDLATLEGMGEMLAAARNEGVILDFANPTPAEVAAQLWLTAPNLLTSVHRRNFLVTSRSYTYYAGQQKGQSLPALNPELTQSMEKELNEWCSVQHYGEEDSKIYLRQHRHIIYIAIYHGLPIGESPFFRARSCDLLKYDTIRNELAVQATTIDLAIFYRALIGRYFFADAEYFIRMEKFTLAPLETDMHKALVCTDSMGMLLVRLTELHRIPERGEAEILQSHQCLSRRIIRHPALMSSATFTLHFEDETTGFVTIAMPDKITYSSHEKSPEVEEWLMRRGFIAPPVTV